ncbi:MAG: hypothetical protein HKM06_01110 [Spirochaetales bacterium]|nr:hypothetical protein [Spirochaetales bacterium]
MNKLLPIALSLALFVQPLVAQTASTPSPDLSTSQAEQDFFGTDQPTVEKAKKDQYDPTLAFTSQGVSWGGVLYDKVEWDGGWIGDWPHPWSLSDNWNDSVNFTLNNIFYMDSRPNKNFRVHVALVSNWPFTNTLINASTGLPTTVPTVRIWELFSDVSLDNSILIRFGKQEADWGVGYFYSAGDVLSLSSIDPTNPTAEREGPVALKVSVPFPNQRADFSLFTVAPDSLFNPTVSTVGAPSPTFRDLAYAAKGDLAWNGVQWSLSGYYQRDESKKLVASASGGLGWIPLSFAKDVNWFTEQIAAYGSDRWIGSGSQNLNGMTTFAVLSRPWQYYFSNVSGIFYTNSEYNASFRVEYYYNGEGSNDQGYAQKLYNAYFTELSNPGSYSSAFGPATTLGTNDIVYPGVHNLTALLTFTTLANSKFDASALLQQNFSDGSGWIRPLLTYNFNDYFSLYAGFQVVWGQNGTQFPLQFLTYSTSTPQTQRVNLVLGGQIGSSRY